MPDATDFREPRDTWQAAFARLPSEAPAPDGWQRVASALDGAAVSPRASRPSRRDRFAWLAVAATLLLAVALPWRPGGDDAAVATPAVAARDDAPSLDALYAESARLEVLLAHARDGSVASGSAAAMYAELEGRLAAIDTALAQPGLPPARQAALWQARVSALEALVGFEGTRRWLAANGAHYDGALVQVN